MGLLHPERAMQETEGATPSGPSLGSHVPSLPLHSRGHGLALIRHGRVYTKSTSERINGGHLGIWASSRDEKMLGIGMALGARIGSLGNRDEERALTSESERSGIESQESPPAVGLLANNLALLASASLSAERG